MDDAETSSVAEMDRVDPKITNGLEALLSFTLQKVSDAKSRGERDIWQYTQRYFDALNLAKRYCSPQMVKVYADIYDKIIGNGHTAYNIKKLAADIKSGSAGY